MIQTKTNARSTLTTVATIPTVLTPKVHLTVVVNQGTWEMATTVLVSPVKSFSIFFDQLKLFVAKKNHKQNVQASRLTMRLKTPLN